MVLPTSRRGFLRGAFNEAAVLRPFGSAGEAAFVEACTACGDCADACPEAVLVADDKGRPVFQPALGACRFCGACIEVCATAALADDRGWRWRASVKTDCLSLSGVQCRTCQDHCDRGAIRFQLMTGGRARPNLDADLCIGCGGCVAACPVGAIGLSRPPSEKEVHTC